jgi:hypothetical protein
VGLGSGLSALSLLIFDRLSARGKNLATIDGKIDGLCEQVEAMESDLKVVDGLTATVRELTQEWRGIDGQNGYRAIIKESAHRIAEIEKRNWEIDAVRREDDRRSGGQHRREIDRVFERRSLPEEREGKD